MTFGVFEKNNMRKILLLVLPLLLLSCGVEYDAETRLVSETKIVDKLGNPIGGQPVEVWVSDNGLSDMISNTVTNANGESLLIFPAPNDLENGRIEIRFPQNNAFQEKRFMEIKRDDFTDYKYTLNDVVLYPLEDLTYLFIELLSTSGGTLTALYLENNSAADFVYINQPEEQSEPQTYFQVLKNSTVDLVYTVRSPGGVESTQSVAVPVGNANTSYTLNY